MAESTGTEHAIPTNVDSKLRTKELTITPALLRQTFSSRKFLGNISGLIDHLDDMAEGGFIVQAKNDKPLVWEPDYAPVTTSIEDRHESLTTVHRGLFDAMSPNLEHYKQGIFLSMHTHPNFDYNTEKSLAPSVHDLDTWQEMRLRSKNNHLIAGILVQDGRFFLYQADPEKPQQNHYQLWQAFEGLGKLRQMMGESGIRSEIIKFDVGENSVRISPHELAKVEAFAT